LLDFNRRLPRPLHRVLPRLRDPRARLVPLARGRVGGESPNGCARPYDADVGLVGRSATRNPDGTPVPSTSTIFLGRRANGDRLIVIFKVLVCRLGGAIRRRLIRADFEDPREAHLSGPLRGAVEEAPLDPADRAVMTGIVRPGQSDRRPSSAPAKAS